MRRVTLRVTRTVRVTRNLRARVNIHHKDKIIIITNSLAARLTTTVTAMVMNSVAIAGNSITTRATNHQTGKKMSNYRHTLLKYIIITNQVF